LTKFDQEFNEKDPKLFFAQAHMQTLHAPCIHMSFLSHPNLHRELFEMAQAMWRHRLLFQFQDYTEDEDCEEILLASIVYQLANDINL